MTWDNYGQWHIDHIKPVALFEFDSTDDPGFRDCWTLDNLQPLWALDNLRKGNKYNKINGLLESSTELSDLWLKEI
jgi:hypothetical protein